MRTWLLRFGGSSVPLRRLDWRKSGPVAARAPRRPGMLGIMMRPALMARANSSSRAATLHPSDSSDDTRDENPVVAARGIPATGDQSPPPARAAAPGEAGSDEASKEGWPTLMLEPEPRVVRRRRMEPWFWRGLLGANCDLNPSGRVVCISCSTRCAGILADASTFSILCMASSSLWNQLARRVRARAWTGINLPKEARQHTYHTQRSRQN